LVYIAIKTFVITFGLLKRPRILVGGYNGRLAPTPLCLSDNLWSSWAPHQYLLARDMAVRTVEKSRGRL